MHVPSHIWSVLVALWIITLAVPAFAADTTAPTAPAFITDDGAYTTDPTKLHAVWAAASDPDSGIAEYEYIIRLGSAGGTIIVNYTSAALALEVTRTGLSLANGSVYYIGVRAKNGAGLYSTVRYSNGIKVDTTPPTASGQPTEGSAADLDFDSDGSYTVYWPAATDAQSGIQVYEIRERVGTSGTWTTLTNTRTAASWPVSGRLHNTRYFYQVRAQNKAAIWGPWSAVSDGMLVDRTAPATVTVTDDGAVNRTLSTLHASWTASADAESGVVDYQYIIRQDTTGGTVVVNWTSVGLALSVTRTGLSLAEGKLHYIGVRGKNGASLYSATKYSDGIRAPDSTAPTAPGQPTEGSTTDLDFDSDGSYTVYWPAATDAQCGIALYELQESQAGAAGPWTSLVSNRTTTSFSVSGRADNTVSVYRVRAQNNVGIWGPWSAVSDGIRVDRTGPSVPPAVTDDGATTTSATTLHARWTAAVDAESGIVGYEYIIRLGSTGGTIVVNYTSVNLALEVTRPGLNLANGSVYYIGVRAKNGAGLYSTTRYSDGIRVQTRPGPSVTSVSGRQLMLQKRNLDGTLGTAAPYIMRGVTWSPASRDTNTTPTDPNNPVVRRPEFGNWYLTDIRLMQAMNVNTVRLFIDLGIDTTLGPLGLTILDELYSNGIMAVMTVDNAINDTARAQQVVAWYKDHPAILGWSLGNEWNINRYYGVASSVADAAQRTQTAAALLKSLDTNHVIISSYGEIDFGGADTNLAATQNYVNNVCPSVDVWSLNLYRGRTFTSLWTQWSSITTKPMFIGEFGIDAYDTTHSTVDEPTQAAWDVDLWNDVARNLSAKNAAKAAIGGTVFEWNDEWWKVSPAGSQQTGGWTSGGFPDGMGNEEYFGIVSVDRTPRVVWGALTLVFDPAYVPPPRTITFRATSRGANAAEWLGQYGAARFFQDGVKFYERWGGGGGGRGFNVGAIDTATGTVLNTGQNFDTYITRSSGTAMTSMIDYLASLPNGTLILVAVADDAGLNLDNSCARLGYSWVEQGIQTLEALGATQIRNYCFRNSYTFAAVKGQGARGEQLGNGIETAAEATTAVP